MRVKEEREKGDLKLNIQKTKIMTSGPIISWQIDGEKVEAVINFLRLQNHSGWLLQPWNSKTLAPWKKNYDKPKIQRHYFANKSPSSQSYSFSSSHVWMWELDYKESWVSKNWSFWTVVLEKALESPLDFQEIQPVNPEGNEFWIFIKRTDAKAEAPILWSPVVKSQFIGKDPNAGKD